MEASYYGVAALGCNASTLTFGPFEADLRGQGNCANMSGEPLGFTFRVSSEADLTDEIAGSCSSPQPEQPSLSAPAPSWDEYHRTCHAPMVAGTCNDSQVCVNAPAAPFARNICVFRQGRHSCPTGYQDSTYDVYGGYEDSRGCDDCTCVPRNAGETLRCDLTVHGNFAEDCEGVAFPIRQVCQSSAGVGDDFGSLVRSAEIVDINIFGASNFCRAGGGDESGRVTESEPVTVCCRATD
ncbi:MAG: hypothetical protein B7733_12055 [Myxococcales bacterium FL481]|nr:MAG: hypothetical protein B7733_12055 [Myxococcales bacterium FL481]